MNRHQRKRILDENAKAERWAARSMIASGIVVLIAVIRIAIRIGGGQ